MKKTAEILAARFDGRPRYNRVGPGRELDQTVSFDLVIDGKWIITTRRMMDNQANPLSIDKLSDRGRNFGNIIKEYGCEGYTVTNGDCVHDYGNGIIWVEERGGVQKYRDGQISMDCRTALEVEKDQLDAFLGGIEQKLRDEK